MCESGKLRKSDSAVRFEIRPRCRIWIRLLKSATGCGFGLVLKSDSAVGFGPM